MRFRKRVHEIVETARPGDTLSKGFDIFIVTLITLNIVALILESVEGIRVVWPGLFSAFECVSVIIFTVEYLMRLWVCVEMPRYQETVIGRLRFAGTPLAIVDLFAVLPFYLPIGGLDLRFLRAVRMMRIFRVAKLGRYSQSLRLLLRVLTVKKEQLISAVLILLLLLIIAASTMYFAEKTVQPESFSSIPAAMWWAVATLTTVGYGDVYPITPLGKLMAAVLAVLGIGMFALPTGILGAGFVEEIEKSKANSTKCPHCGKAI
jgi:voltage-gated potassium channel